MSRNARGGDGGRDPKWPHGRCGSRNVVDILVAFMAWQ